VGASLARAGMQRKRRRLSCRNHAHVCPKHFRSSLLDIALAKNQRSFSGEFEADIVHRSTRQRLVRADVQHVDIIGGRAPIALSRLGQIITQIFGRFENTRARPLSKCIKIPAGGSAGQGVGSPQL